VSVRQRRTPNRTITRVNNVSLYASKTTDTAGVIKRLEEFIKQRGLPDRIVSDRGTAFTSARFEKFCQEQGIHHTLNSTRHPQANGQVERVNRTLIPILSITSVDQYRWDQKLTEIEQNLNTAYNKVTKKTPYETVHGYYPNFRGGAERQLNLNQNLWTPSRKV